MSTLKTTNIAHPSSASNNIVLDSSARVLVGTSSARGVGGAAAAPVEAEVTNYLAYSAVNNTNDQYGCYIAIGKSRGTAVGGNTIVQSGDEIGGIAFAGADGTDVQTQAASIVAYVDGTPGANDMPGRLVLSTTPDSSATPVERMRITSAGKILFGTTTSRGRIHSVGTGAYNPSGTNATWSNDASLVLSGEFGGGLSLIDGSAGYSVFVDDNGNDFNIAQGSITGTVVGGVYINNAAGSWSSRSDERDKVNLAPIENGLNKVKTLRAVIGSYIWAPESRHPFLIAQDVQKVLPEAVSVSNKTADPENQRLGMSYTDMIPLLVQALKEAAEKIETLETKVAALEAA